MASVSTSAVAGYDDVRAPRDLIERDGLSGTVKMFNPSRHFGFIAIGDSQGGGDVFLHLKEVAGGRAPRVGDRVEFDVRFRGPDALRAIDVTPPGERARRALALVAADARRAGQQRALAPLAGAFAAGSAARAAADAVDALPAGLMSGADLKVRAALLIRGQ